ncbi:AAA family ATPase [Candidatus Parcubacteria bacterium]|nr:AAA family ATPase [Candidatus Parcubacteria bacterium]
MIVTLTGPSGVGKTTLLRSLVRALPHAHPLMSYTTRSPRPTDEPGEYTYVGDEQFEKMKSSFLWEAKTYKSRYGTRKEDIDFALAHDIYIPILVMDAVKKLHTYTSTKVTYLYIHIDDENELRRRFQERGDNPEEVEARIAENKTWFKEAQQSGIPFIYLDGKQTREELLAQALKVFSSPAPN